jgi:hypothetical protein
MLSLPAWRSRLAGVRAATGLAEFHVLVVVPSLLIRCSHRRLASVTTSWTRSFTAGVCSSQARCSSVWFLLSTVFGVLAPAAAACFVALALAASEATIQGFSRFGIFPSSGPVYFRSGQLPWLGLLASRRCLQPPLRNHSETSRAKDF